MQVSPSEDVAALAVRYCRRNVPQHRPLKVLRDAMYNDSFLVVCSFNVILERTTHSIIAASARARLSIALACRSIGEYPDWQFRYTCQVSVQRDRDCSRRGQAMAWPPQKISMSAWFFDMGTLATPFSKSLPFTLVVDPSILPEAQYIHECIITWKSPSGANPRYSIRSPSPRLNSCLRQHYYVQSRDSRDRLVAKHHRSLGTM
jgi:hypothetical protein